MKSSIALSALVLLPLTAATAQPAATNQASAEDCAVMQALIGPPPLLITLASDSFGLDCDWVKRLEPSPVVPVGTPDSHQSYGRPTYSPDGLQATEAYWDSYQGTNGFVGAHQHICTLKKRGPGWSFISCATGIIAN
jgi:hypothetical protein